DHVVATHLLPAGASPHTFEPRPSQIRDVARADLIISNGARLDDWIEPLIAAGNPQAERLVLANGVPLLPWSEPSGDGDPDDHAHHHGAFDPHIWLDPVLVKDDLAPRIAQALTHLAPS